MMYTGSNVLPLARFLYVTHNKQAFRSEDEEKDKNSSSTDSKSILAPLLPKAMICFLENYGPEKFSEVFLGNFDTPEAIWNHEMRRFMIEKIAAHISDFTPRLLSNTHAMYQYHPVPKVNFPALEHELFCNIYYLRNLCNTTKYPTWPIKNQVCRLPCFVNFLEKRNANFFFLSFLFTCRLICLRTVWMPGRERWRRSRLQCQWKTPTQC